MCLVRIRPLGRESALTDLSVLVSLLVLGDVDEFLQVRLLGGYVLALRVQEEGRQSFVGGFLELGHVQVELLDVRMLLVIRFDDHPKQMLQ